jgi:hypothetical protein
MNLRAEQIIAAAEAQCLNPATGMMRWPALSGTMQAHVRLLCRELDDVPTLVRNERLTLDSLRQYLRILAINAAASSDADLKESARQLFEIVEQLDDAAIDRLDDEQRAKDAQELREEMAADDERAKVL